MKMSTKEVEITKRIKYGDKNIIPELKNLLMMYSSKVNIQMKELATLKTVNLKLLNLRNEKEKKRMKKSQQSTRDLGNTINQISMDMMGVLLGQLKEKGTDGLFEEVIVENFPNL